MLLAGDPKEPGRAVRGTEVVPDALTFDAGHVDPALREPPQGRRAESPRPITITSLRMISIDAGYALRVTHDGGGGTPHGDDEPDPTRRPGYCDIP